ERKRTIVAQYRRDPRRLARGTMVAARDVVRYAVALPLMRAPAERPRDILVPSAAGEAVELGEPVPVQEIRGLREMEILAIHVLDADLRLERELRTPGHAALREDLDHAVRRVRSVQRRRGASRDLLDTLSVLSRYCR